MRAANTGISAVIDPYGRILSELPLGVAGVLDSELPRPIDRPLFGRYPVETTAAIYLLLGLAAAVRRRRN